MSFNQTQTNNEFTQFFNTGMPLAIIAKKFGIHKSTAQKWKCKLGLHRDSIKRKVSDDDIFNNKNRIRQLAIEHGMAPSSLYERAKKLGIEFNAIEAHRKAADTKRQYNLNLSHFKPLDEIGSYYLGLIYADGCVYRRHARNCHEAIFSIGLKSSDKKCLEKLTEDLNIPPGYLRTHRRKRGCIDGRSICAGWCSQLMVGHYQLIDILCQYGLDPGPEYKRHLPSGVNMPHFIRGFLDGDGTIGISKSNKKYRYLSLQFAITHKSFAEELQNLLFDVAGYDCGHLGKSASIWYLKITGKAAVKIAKWIWANPIRCLDRKYQRYLQYKSEGLI